MIVPSGDAPVGFRGARTGKVIRSMHTGEGEGERERGRKTISINLPSIKPPVTATDYGS